MQAEREPGSGPWIAALIFLQLEARHLRLLRGGSFSLQSRPWVTCQKKTPRTSPKPKQCIQQALDSAESCPVSLDAAVEDCIFSQAFFCQIHLTHAHQKKCILLESGACKGSKLKHNMWYVLAQKQTRFNMACWCWMTCPAVASKIMQLHRDLINVWMFTQLKTLKVLTGSKACHLASDTKQLLQGGPSKTRNGHNSWQTLKAPSNISNVCRVA